MPDLPDSTPPDVSPAVPSPPDPTAWEDFPAFRETFLMYVTPPGYSAALRAVGEMLYSLLLDSPAEWPGWVESSTRTEMRAAAADLRHLQGFLRSVGRERDVSSLDAEDAYLSMIAGKLSRQLERMAAWIEGELAGCRDGMGLETLLSAERYPQRLGEGDARPEERMGDGGTAPRQGEPGRFPGMGRGPVSRPATRLSRRRPGARRLPESRWLRGRSEAPKGAGG
jgi:hypothetical protein